MRNVLIIVVAVGLGIGAYFFFGNGPAEDPPKKPSDAAPPQIGGRTRTLEPGTGNGGGGLPGLPKGGISTMGPLNSASVMAEFTEELGLTEREAAEFREALKKSQEGLLELARIDDGSGVPVLPSHDKLNAHLEERERILTEELGEDGYRSFKAFSTTLPIRNVINRLAGEGGSGLTAEQKKEVLRGAYDEVDAGSIPGSPQEFSKALSAAVLKRSAEYLSDDEQKRFAEAVETDLSRIGPPLPAGGIPGIPPPPPPPGGIGRPPAGIPGGTGTGTPPAVVP